MEVDVSSLEGDEANIDHAPDQYAEDLDDLDVEYDGVDEYDSDDESFAKMMRQEILTLSSSLGITEASTDHVVKLIRQVAVRCRKMDQKHFDSLISSIDGLATPFKRKSAFRADQDGFIEPVFRQMGTFTAPCRGVDGHQSRRDQPCKFCIIPLKSTLSSALQNRELQEVLELNSSAGSTLHSPLDGKRFPDAVAAFPQKRLLPLIVYIDDVAPGSGLRASSSQNALTVMLLTLAGINRHSSSRHRWKWLYAIAYASDHKAYGCKSLFEQFKIELNDLFENGMLVSWRGQNILVHPWLLSVSADNLALNQIQQLQTSFAAGHPCRHCTANCNEFDKILREQDCNPRDLSWYQSHPPPTLGLRGPSPLNEIAGYHVADDAFCDIGHDIMEGEGRRLLGIVVRAVVRGGVSLTEINEKMCAFAVGHVDRDSLPAPITDDVLIGNSISGQKAAQTATLLRLFPFIFPLDPAVPNPEIRQLFFCFAELLRLLQSFYVTPGDIDLVRVLTEKYVTLAWKVVDLDVPPSRSAKTRTSRPTFKSHVLLHYDECLRSLGPVGQLSTLPFEQLNSYLKRRSYVTKNFICLPWTMAVHIQRVLWAMRLQHSPDFVPGKRISPHANSAIAPAVLNRQDSPCTLRLRRHGTLYAAGDVVTLTDRISFVPAKVDTFVHIDGNWKIIVALGSTASFDINRQCFFFALDGRATLASFSDLSDPLPLDGYPEGDKIAFMPRHALSHQ